MAAEGSPERQIYQMRLAEAEARASAAEAMIGQLKLLIENNRPFLPADLPISLLPTRALRSALRAQAALIEQLSLEFDELKRYSQRRAARFMPAWGQGVRAWVEKRLGGPLTTAESQGPKRTRRLV